jgi:peptidoglycan hydrolase CwlO-like protein
MICDESAQQLHDKATRGGTLSSDERAHLDAWLSAQDETEASLLSPKRVEPALAELRSQVNSALKQVGTITRSIQQLTAENESLQREVAALRSRLAVGPLPRPA